MFGKKKEDDFYEESLEMPLGEEKKGGFGKGLLFGLLSGFFLSGIILMGVAYGFQSKNSPVGQKGQSLGGSSSGSVSQGTQGNIRGGILTEDFVNEMVSAYKEIEDNFLYEFDREEMQDAMLKAMLNALGDPYSVYYNEEDLISFNQQTEGEYYGIGCSVQQDPQTGIITIVKPYKNAPAYEAGLLSGDILVAVNDEEVTGVDLTTVVNMIKGLEGSFVKLTIQREGEDSFLNFEVTRRQVKIDTVEYEMLSDKIGYMEVISFDGVTPEQFQTAFEALKKEKMEGLIIDMRDNPGGQLSAVEKMLDYLLPEGLIFYAKDKDGNKYLEYKSDRSSALGNLPLVILVNGNTASAGEVFSGNCQAFGKATLVGETTFGKGIMQNIFYTNADMSCAVKLTVADYYIHGDKNIHKIGLTPDVEIALDEEIAKKDNFTKEEDNQLQKALEIVKEKMAGR